MIQVERCGSYWGPWPRKMPGPVSRKKKVKGSKGPGAPIPEVEVADDGGIARAVIGFEGVERLVGEHDAEAEGVVRAIALEHGDAPLRPGLLHQDREVEAGRASADDVNLHLRLHRNRHRISRP